MKILSMSSKKFFGFFVIIWFVFVGCVSNIRATMDNAYWQSVLVGGVKRDYLVFTPSRISPSKPLYAVIVLHGGLGNAERMAQTTKLHEFLTVENFLVVYPNGTLIGRFGDHRTWNAGICCGPAAKQNINDVGFISSLIDKLALEFSVKRDKVIVVGFSNGAMLAYRLACEIPDKIQVIIPVAGSLVYDQCLPERTRDVGIIHIHGIDDENVPIKGGVGKKGITNVNYPPLERVITMFSRHRGCQDREEITSSDGRVILLNYKCMHGAPIRVYLIKNWGHSWPDIEQGKLFLQRGRFKDSYSKLDFSVSSIIMKFIKNPTDHGFKF